MLWLTWWTRIVGTTPTVVLAHLHHLGQSGARRVDLQDLADWITPIEDPIQQDGYPLMRLHWALTRLAQWRLAVMCPIRIDGPPHLMVLADPIPRPGPAGFKAIGEAVGRLTTNSSGMIKGLGDDRG